MLILASASPRRRELLRALGVEFELFEPNVEELTDGGPEHVVLENARRKVGAALAQAKPGAVVLGSDTEVVLDGRVLGKAEGEEEARVHLEALSGRSHTVLTSLVIARAGGSERGEGSGGSAIGGERTGIARSEVTFRELDRATLDLYLRSGEWRGRAGAYAIQGLGSILVERLAGDFSNVVGLPVPLLLELAPELLRPGKL